MRMRQLAQQGVVEEAVARARIGALIPHALASAARRVKAPAGDLARLTDYRKQAVYLGHINLLLSAYASVGGKQHDALHASLSKLLAEALRSAAGRPLHSFPGLVWPFDTVPVLVSLHRFDPAAAKPLIRAHHAWLRNHATDAGTGLPFSKLHPTTWKGIEAPRGCDVSWRIALLSEIAPEVAAKQYTNYVEHFWLDRVVVAGFAEWANGKPGRQDVDSGPIFMGIGSAASTLGIAAATTRGDDERLAQLLATATRARGMLPMLGKSLGAANDDRYATGFLYGDAVLFYATSFAAVRPDASM